MGKGNAPIVDYFDLKITLPEHVIPAAQKALSDFEDHHDYMVIAPKLKNETLKINSTDFIAWLGYLDTSELSEIDLRRIQSDAENQMQQYVAKTVNADTRSHYQWCLAALKNLNWGRHKTGS